MGTPSKSAWPIALEGQGGWISSYIALGWGLATPGSQDGSRVTGGEAEQRGCCPVGEARSTATSSAQPPPPQVAFLLAQLEECLLGLIKNWDPP